MSTDKPAILDLYLEICDLNLLEDRREYDVSLLKDMYHLTQQEGEDLNYLIQSNFDPKLQGAPRLDDIPAEVFKEFFLEGLHNGWDGWDDEHIRLAFNRQLDDLRLYAKGSATITSSTQEQK